MLWPRVVAARWCNRCIHQDVGFHWHYGRVDRIYLLYHFAESSEFRIHPFFFGKNTGFSWFFIQHPRNNITAVWFVIAMPTCMAIYFGLVYLCRGPVDQWKAAEALVLKIVWDACNRYRLVADYFQRPQMNEAFSGASGSLRTTLFVAFWFWYVLVANLTWHELRLVLPLADHHLIERCLLVWCWFWISGNFFESTRQMCTMTCFPSGWDPFSLLFTSLLIPGWCLKVSLPWVPRQLFGRSGFWTTEPKQTKRIKEGDLTWSLLISLFTLIVHGFKTSYCIYRIVLE